MNVAVSTSLTFNNINGALTGQGGVSFFANNPTTYGSAFLLANLVISGNSFDGGLAVVNEISANNSALSFGSNDVNRVAFDTLQVGGAGADTLTGGTEVDAFVFAEQGTADTITDDVGGSGGMRAGSMMPPSPASPPWKAPPLISGSSPPAISARPSAPALTSSTTAMPSGKTPMAWPAVR
jgi:hypothetical protein